MKRLQKYQSFVDDGKKVNEGLIKGVMKFMHYVTNAQIFLGYILEGKFKKAKFYMKSEYNDFIEKVSQLSEFLIYVETLMMNKTKEMDEKELESIIDEYKMRYHSNMVNDMLEVKKFIEHMAGENLNTGHLTQQYSNFNDILEVLEQIANQ